MKTTISDFVIAFFDLVEAEGRAFKNNTERIVEKTAKNKRQYDLRYQT